MKTAREIMTQDPITVDPETPVAEIAAILHERRINGVPVVDGTGAVVGVVTESDLIEGKKKLHIPTVINLLDAMIFLENPARTDRELKKMTATRAADVMTERPVTITGDTPVDEIATIMSEKKVHTLPVLDQEGRLAGVVGRADIIKVIMTGS